MVQFHRLKNFGVVESSPSADTFLLRVYGDFESLSDNIETSNAMVDQCLRNAEISVGNYQSRNVDYTKCHAYEECKKVVNNANSEINFVDSLEISEPPPVGKEPGFQCSGAMCTLTLPTGTTFIGKDHGGIVEFRGIPYAIAPVNELRFRPPVVRIFQNETLDGINYGKKCATHQMEADQSEDCLTVNIAVARTVIESGHKVPIVYYIHGGGFNHGSNQVQFDNLVRVRTVGHFLTVFYRAFIFINTQIF